MKILCDREQLLAIYGMVEQTNSTHSPKPFADITDIKVHGVRCNYKIRIEEGRPIALLTAHEGDPDNPVSVIPLTETTTGLLIHGLAGSLIFGADRSDLTDPLQQLQEAAGRVASHK